MLTASSPEEAKDTPINLIEDYIIKPFIKNELVAKITEIIEKHKAIPQRAPILKEKF